jgi:hypothetical protein
MATAVVVATVAPLKGGFSDDRDAGDSAGDGSVCFLDGREAIPESALSGVHEIVPLGARFARGLQSGHEGARLERLKGKHALGMSDRGRLVVLLAIASALVWFIPESPAKLPLLMILLGLPLVFGLVPKNWLYGMRSPRTMFWSDDVWYTQNRITGVAMLSFGLSSWRLASH